MPPCTTTSPPRTPHCMLSPTVCVTNYSSSATTKHTKETSLHPKNKHMRTSTMNTTTHMMTSTTPRTNTSTHHMHRTSTSIMHTTDTSQHYTKNTTHTSPPQKNQLQSISAVCTVHSARSAALSNFY